MLLLEENAFISILQFAWDIDGLFLFILLLILFYFYVLLCKRKNMTLFASFLCSLYVFIFGARLQSAEVQVSWGISPWQVGFIGDIFLGSVDESVPSAAPRE